MSSVYCVVTVPTEPEERRLHIQTSDFATSNRASTVKAAQDDMRSRVSFSNDDVELCNGSRRPRNTTGQNNKVSSKNEKNSENNRSNKKDDYGLSFNTKLPCSNGIYNDGVENSEMNRIAAEGCKKKYKKHSYQKVNAKTDNLDTNSNSGEEKLISNLENDQKYKASNKSGKKSWDILRELISSGRRRDDDYYHVRLNVKQCTSLERVLRDIIHQLEVQGVFWCHDIDNCLLQARFTMLLDQKYERLILTLHEWGIGERLGTSISVMNCSDTKCSSFTHQMQTYEAVSTWERFMDSVRCRLNVNHVVRKVQQEATITFDFLVLLIAATILACFGLVENSHLFLSSSMLISPLMGPIIAGVFGTVIKDHKLRILGFKNELFGIAIATFIGLIFGLIVCFMGHFFVISEGLTQEIMSRCETRSLSVGFFTALASGAAGAIGVLGGNLGSLVGVAISASLLPPAVNSGLLWALAIGTPFFSEENRILKNLIKENIYSDDQSVELIVYASISMGLTVLNIICVWAMGVLVLRVKEIAPHIRSENEKFWKYDIKVARRTGYESDTGSRLDEYKRLDKIFNITDSSYQNTWSPDSRCSGYKAIGNRRQYHTVHGFDEININVCKKGCETEQTTLEPLNQSITVMELFSQGPLDHSKSSTKERTGTTKTDDSTKITITSSKFHEHYSSIDGRSEQALIQYVGSKRPSFGSYSNPPSICFMDDCKHHVTWSNMVSPWHGMAHTTEFGESQKWADKEKLNEDTNADAQKPCTSAQARKYHISKYDPLSENNNKKDSSSSDNEYEV